MVKHEASDNSSKGEQEHQRRIGFDAVFPDFTAREGYSLPRSVHLGEDGMFYDDSSAMYVVRRTVGGVGDEVAADQLFHGTKPSWHNATQGAGLYVANTKHNASRAAYLNERQSSVQYLLRVSPEATVFDANRPMARLSSQQKLAATTLRTLAVAPGMPWPTPRLYDALYGDADVVVFTPSAMQRRRSELVDAVKIPQRFVLLRDTSKCEIMATDDGRQESK